MDNRFYINGFKYNKKKKTKVAVVSFGGRYRVCLGFISTSYISKVNISISGKNKNYLSLIGKATC